jgi:acyl-CoA hydrolase
LAFLLAVVDGKEHMKKLVLVIFLVLLACAEKHPPQPAIAQGATVLILGDSLSYGTGAKPEEAYPELLEKATGWHIVNAGIPGDTTSGGLQRLPNLLEEHQPKLLLIELGGNDLLRQVPTKQVEENLKSIIAQAKTQGVQIALVAIPEISPLMAAVGNLSDHPLYARVAEETKVPLITDIFSDVLSKRDLKADQIHPNAQGYVEVAKAMQETLKALGFVRAP